MAKKHKYRVRVVRKVSSTGSFEVTSANKLTEDEVIQRGYAMANEGVEPDGGWEETDTEYDDAEVEDGAEDLKEE